MFGSLPLFSGTGDSKLAESRRLGSSGSRTVWFLVLVKLLPGFAVLRIESVNAGLLLAVRKHPLYFPVILLSGQKSSQH